MRTSRLLTSVTLFLALALPMTPQLCAQSWAWVQNVDIRMKDRDQLSAITEVLVEGDRAYCVLWWGVQVLDISNPSAPIKLGECTVPDRDFPTAPYMFRDAVKYGNYILEGNLLFDVSVATAPTFVKEFPFNIDFGLSLAMSGDKLVLTSPQGMISIYDFSSPEFPVLLHQWQASSELGAETVSDAACVDGLLYLSTGTHSSMLIIDISVPSAPVTVGRIPLGSPSIAISVSGNYAALVYGSNGPVELFDVSAPSSPVSLGQYQAAGNYLREVTLDGMRAYCIDAAAKLKVVDFSVSDPPTLHTERQAPTGNPNVGAWNDVVVANGLVFLARSDIGLEVLSPVGDDLTLIGQYFCNDYLRDISSDGQYLYVASWRVGLRVFSLADPLDPELVATVPLLRVTSIVREGTALYLGRRTDGMFVIVDVSDPIHPVIADSVLITGYCEDMVVQDGKLYVADRYQGLRIYSLANPLAPVQVGSITTGMVTKLAISGNTLVMCIYGTGTYYVDVTDPAHPILRGLLPGPSGLFESLVTDGRYVYVIYDGMHVYDMLDPDHIVEVGAIPYVWPKAGGPAEAEASEAGTGEGSLIIDGNYLWLASNGGLGLYDIRDRTRPDAIIGYNSNSNYGSAALNQRRIYLAQEHGLTTLEYTKCCEEMAGDINMDGHRDLTDLSLTIMYVLYRSQTTSICGPAVDIDGNRKVDLTDLSMSIAYLTGAIPSLPNCQ